MKKNLFQTLAEANTEEELKNFFARRFKLKLDTKNFIDLYTLQILFEFKLDKNLKNPQVLAEIVAQTLYYVRRLKFGNDHRPVSENICVVTKNFAALFPTETFANFYDDKDAYKWNRAPSTPCEKLSNALAEFDAIKNAFIYDLSVYALEVAFTRDLGKILNNQYGTTHNVKQINEQNFESIFKYWLKLFGKDVKNGRKPSEYFMTDIEQGKSHIHDRKVFFELVGEQTIKKFVNPNDYNKFWSMYYKIKTVDEITAIRRKMDRMTEENLRRRTGEFYTPLPFADEAFEYLQKTVGEWWLDENFRLWDMAAGTGNLEFNFSPDILKRCYISTLIQDDADYCKSIFTEATVFQFDFLNDDESKLPEKLRNDLADPNIKWIIYINPPYATANNYKLDKTINKDKVADTSIRKQMAAEKLRNSSQELFSQFIYRISKIFSNRIAYLGIFSTLRYIVAGTDQEFRDKVFRYKFERGFVFSSQNFQGCTGKFSVGFLVWNLSNQIPIESQKILLDIYNPDVEQIGEKTFSTSRSNELLNKWIERPRRTKKFPPMVSALKFCDKNIRCDIMAENFLADFMCMSNDFIHQGYTSFLSGVYAGGSAISVTAENFEQCMIIHMVRRLPKRTLFNDKDQFMQPTRELSREFICDAVIWSLFAPSNQTVSLRDVEYEGEVYQIANNFYPFELAEIKSWECSSPAMRLQIFRAVEDRFAALWIKNHRDELSTAAISVLNSARTIYKRFYLELERLDVAKWKIETWDAGWYQIRMSLNATIDLSELSKKLEPQIYEFGFLRDEVRYF